MAGTSADKLALLKSTKADLKAALAEKGQNPGDVFSSYPGMVRAIDTQEDLSAEMTAQDSLIAQIATALEGKAAGGPDYIEVTITTTETYLKAAYLDENRERQIISGDSTATVKAFLGIVCVHCNNLHPTATGSYAVMDTGYLHDNNSAVYIFLFDGGTIYITD